MGSGGGDMAGKYRKLANQMVIHTESREEHQKVG